MGKLKIMVVFGTRPEAIKMAPLVLELQKQKEVIETITVVTAQHRQMLDQVLETFNIVPDYDLDIMGKSQTLLDITSKILNQLDPVIKKEKPDMVLSGINAGANIGPDILYSGTVAAATEAAHMGYRSMALSFDSFQPENLYEQAAFAAELIERIPWKSLPSHCVLNLNFPNLPMAKTKGLKVCEQTDAVWKDWYEEAKDPRGNTYWWLNGEIPAQGVASDSDHALLGQGYITLTPLRFEFTDHTALRALQDFTG